MCHARTFIKFSYLSNCMYNCLLCCCVICHKFNHSLRYNSEITGKKSKQKILVADIAEFTWKVVWSEGSEIVNTSARVDNALHQGIPLPTGWRAALTALRLLKDARRIPASDLPLEVPEIHCDMIGVPKRVVQQAHGRSPGTLITLTEQGCPVNYVLLAHVHADVWICSPGNLLLDILSSSCTLLQGDKSCVEKDLSVHEFWFDTTVPGRRVRKHSLAGNLQQYIKKYGLAFDELVADQTWKAEERLAVMEGRTIQIDAAGFMYERNPFRWQSDGWISQVVTQFVWHWQEHHVFQFKRVSVHLNNAIQGDLPLPDKLITDATLHKRLLKRAERETKQTYCECKYLGLKTESGFEPNPAAWTIDGRKSHQQVWLEFSNVRNASTNRLHRVPVHVTTLLNRSTRAPGNPLTVTAARRLRFSLEFMDAFANEKMPGMTFCGVMYDCPDRPEFVRQLPNDVDIQHEKFFWNLPSGECICKSLVELRDMQPDELTPEDHIDSYKEVADQLGYDILGVPATDLDNSKFDEYRRANDLGNLSERRWEQDIIWAKPEKESEKCWFISNAGLKELLDICVHMHCDVASLYLCFVRMLHTGVGCMNVTTFSN